MRGARLLLISSVLLGCGSSTGLPIPNSTRPVDGGGVDGGRFDASMPDAGMDATVEEDGGTDAGTDAFIPCPPDRTVAPREASVPVDILFVFDSSGSMIDENARLQENIGIFWDAIVDADVDSHVVFIAERGYVPGPPSGFARRYLGIEDRVGSWDPLLKVLDNYPTYRNFMRPGSVVHVVAVTDDDSRAIEWEAFDEEFRRLIGRDYTAHSIASEQVMVTITNPFGSCFTDDNSATRPGFEYMGLSMATGGLFLSVCEEDWSQIVEPLSERVAVRVPLPCAYALPQPPPGGGTYDPDTFNVTVTFPDGTTRSLPQVSSGDACGAGWSFVPVADRIELCPSTCAETDMANGRLTIELCGSDTLE
ncbi:MAG: hypothetical protein H6722_26475 [Sandaracinus sp.]|nr:hypothetical protein [Sandaracinus sp.]MCB9618603.1 hypothetical protein [Sandaracinus sp.]